jgi:hypothetical protein
MERKGAAMQSTGFAALTFHVTTREVSMARCPPPTSLPAIDAVLRAGATLGIGGALTRGLDLSRRGKTTAGAAE